MKNNLFYVNLMVMLFVFITLFVGCSMEPNDADNGIGSKKDVNPDQLNKISAAIETMYLSIHRLHCNETEDFTGADECQLKIWVDGKYWSYRRDLNNNQDWPLNLPYYFSNFAIIELWDLDAGKWWDQHDLLGSIYISPSSVDYAQGVFNNDGSDYYIEYTVQ
jgi:hypothetical protein